MNQSRISDASLPDEQEAMAPSGSVQVLAMITLLLGVLSSLALVKPLFWVFPLVALALGALSLVSLARNPERIGRKAAWLGIVLAVFFGAWAPSRHFSRQAWLVHHARNNAEIFLDLLRQQKLEEAHQLHLHQNQRRKSGVPLEEYYESRPEARTDYNAFFSVPPLDELVPSAATATFRFQGLDAYVHEDYEDTLLLRYLASFQKNGRNKSVTMRLVMRRYLHRQSGQTCWAVYRVVPGDRPLSI